MLNASQKALSHSFGAQLLTKRQRRYYQNNKEFFHKNPGMAKEETRINLIALKEETALSSQNFFKIKDHFLWHF